MAKKKKKKIPTEQLKTKYAVVEIQITETPWKDDTKTVTAEVVSAEEEKLTGEKRSITVKKSDDLFQKRNQVRNRLREAIDEICEADHVDPSLAEIFWSRAKDLRDLSVWYDLCPPNWRSDRNTKNPAIRYFALHALGPVSDAIANKVYGPDVAQRVANEILDDVLSNQEARSGVSEDSDQEYTESIEKMKLAGAKALANQHIRECNELFAGLRDQTEYPDAYPYIYLPLFDNALYIPPEQCKALAPETLITFAALLRLSIERNPLSFGGVLMMCAMTRTAEAVCPKFKEILVMNGYAVYGVIWQSDGNVRIADLKTESSYRLIVLPKFAVDCLEMRRCQLKLQGYRDTEIDEMYVVAAPDDPYKPAKPGRLSAYIRTLISLAGNLDSDFWGSANELMLAEPDPVPAYAKFPELVAYILRRSGCSYLCNCAGCDPRVVDVMMGHLLRRADFSMVDKIKNEDMWKVIADHMECIVYDPKYSANPACLARTLTEEKQYGVPHRRIKVCITEDMIRDGRVTLSVETLRSDDIAVTVPENVVDVDHSTTRLIHDDVKYPSIWEELDQAVFDRCIKQATKIFENNKEVFNYES